MKSIFTSALATAVVYATWTDELNEIKQSVEESAGELKNEAGDVMEEAAANAADMAD